LIIIIVAFLLPLPFLPNETEASYTWALTQIQELYSFIQPTFGFALIEPLPSPGAISTDCDQALRNAISVVLSTSATLLCLWHANKNIQQHCKPKVAPIGAWDDFNKAWQGTVRSPTPTEYEHRLHQFEANYSTLLQGQQCASYIKATWLKPGRKESLIQAWTNNYTHFGITVTSRYYPFAHT
jgi:hypothetical protein